MLTDIKLSKNHSIRSISCPLIKLGVPLAKDFLTPLAIMASTSAINGAVQRKMRGSGAGALRMSYSFQMKILMILLES